MCTIYYPEERASGSWADAALSLMRYNVDPGKLQCAIRQIFRHATSRVVVPGTEVVPMPLFEVLDARDGETTNSAWSRPSWGEGRWRRRFTSGSRTTTNRRRRDDEGQSVARARAVERLATEERSHHLPARHSVMLRFVRFDVLVYD